MNINELRKNMMMSKKDNKEKGLILSLLLDKTLKIAKEDKNREPLDSDIATAAKTMLKQAEQSKEMGMNVDYEIEILKDFIPQTLSYEETEKLIVSIVEKIEVKNVGNILATLRREYSNTPIDMKIASEIAKKF